MPAGMVCFPCPVQAFLWERTGQRISTATGIERHRVCRMALLVRACMTADQPASFGGDVEIDETYIGGSKYNKRRNERTGKRGHGTDKQPILGIYHRETRRVLTIVVPDLKRVTINTRIRRHVAEQSRIHTDTFSIYDHLHRWYRHERVNHRQGEYVRGDIHTNGIEGFWGCLKRRLKTTGGIRRSRLQLYVGEYVWRFNHRQTSLEEQTELLLDLVADL